MYLNITNGIDGKVLAVKLPICSLYIILNKNTNY